MIEEIGTITAVDQDHICVETQIKTTCSGCEANDNCGTGVVAKAFAPKTERLIFRCDAKATVGQKVRLGIPETALLSASLMVYMIPLFVLIVSAVLGQSLLPAIGLGHEGFVIGFAFAATAFSFWRIKTHVGRDKSEKYHPRLLELLPQDPDTIPIKISD